MTRVALVTGAGGFIGHHLISYLVGKGYRVRGVDIKQPEYETSSAHEFQVLDLRRFDNCLIAAAGVDEVYHLAADMGGIGYITSQHAKIARNDTMMNIHMLEAARICGSQRFIFSSSACVYPQHLQVNAEVTPLKEADAWPADPEEGYGLEKLYMEKLCQYYREDWKLTTRVMRFHNVYGPLGTYDGGKEKAPAAISRKVALCPPGGTLDVWGDGQQTRSFMYIDDCVEGIFRIMHSDYPDPLNLGTDVMVTIDELVDIVAGVAGKPITIHHDLTKPQGVRGRNSDNTLLRKVIGWEPSISLQEGLTTTYSWIWGQLAASGKAVYEPRPDGCSNALPQEAAAAE
jgi:GDP-D-mannose 3',5'-epimerase